MNDRLQSHVRHILTALFAGLVLFLKHKFISQGALIDMVGTSLNNAIDPATLVIAGYIGSVLVKAVGKWPWLSFFIGKGAGSGGSAALMLVTCTAFALLAVSLTSCSTTSITRTDAKGYKVVTETKALDTGFASLAGQLIQGLTGAKAPKPPKAAKVQPMPIRVLPKAEAEAAVVNATK
ncbi:hypothetical protein [Luteolibacter sp. LG18]|uniref:hypothetical protein n=1 Tax=Luteolibacter sp. LG18 TaxID=2819286 RepID=UPI0030C70949